MKYVLVKFKDIKLLINDSCDTQQLIEQLKHIEALAQKVNAFYRDLIDATPEQAAAIEKEKQQLVSKIGYTVIGAPFTNSDAELYAIEKKLNYTELELTL